MTIQLTINAPDAADLKRQLRELLGDDQPSPVKETVVKNPPAVAPPAEKPVETQASKPSQKPSDTSTTATTAAPPAGEVSEEIRHYNDVIKPAVLKVSQKHGRDGVLKLLAKFDVSNASKIPADRHGELMTAITEMLED